MVPVFLEKYKEKVMHSGKYLNVIRECGRDVKYPFDQENFMKGMLPVVDEEMNDGGGIMQMKGSRDEEG